MPVLPRRFILFEVIEEVPLEDQLKVIVLRQANEIVELDEVLGDVVDLALAFLPNGALEEEAVVKPVDLVLWELELVHLDREEAIANGIKALPVGQNLFLPVLPQPLHNDVSIRDRADVDASSGQLVTEIFEVLPRLLLGLEHVVHRHLAAHDIEVHILWEYIAGCGGIGLAEHRREGAVVA